MCTGPSWERTHVSAELVRDMVEVTLGKQALKPVCVWGGLEKFSAGMRHGQTFIFRRSFQFLGEHGGRGQDRRQGGAWGLSPGERR